MFSRPASLASSDPWVHGLWKVRDSIWATLQEMLRQKQNGTAVERSYDVQAGGMARTPLICVAEVTDDLYRRRENLCSALAQTNDFKVSLWAHPTPPPVSGLNVLPVHMFGRYPGRAYMGSQLALSRLQLEATIKAKPARRPIVWTARDLNFDDAETDELKESLNSLLNSCDIELPRTDLEDLKEELRARMQVRDTPAPKAVRQSHESPIVHIWYQFNDPALLSPLKQYLRDNDCGIQVYNCASTQLEKMQSRLAMCDGLMIPYTADGRTWAEDLLTEAFRLRRREERPTAFAAVELPPPTDDEFNFEHPRVIPIHLDKPGTFDKIDAFLIKLEQESA